ncbi:hypothetical protein JCM8202v2_005153 [Rhodotorula sphaerocarpa]
MAEPPPPSPEIAARTERELKELERLWADAGVQENEVDLATIASYRSAYATAAADAVEAHQRYCERAPELE